ncbi:MAG: hypothetical protein HYT16_01200 [DPANN group archaeon]|nr:hypothetical protein [DPANN group archaeon]
MALSQWRTSEQVIARYAKPGFLEGFAVDSSEYAIILKGGALTGYVISGGIVKRSFWDIFGKTSFIFADGRPRQIYAAISAVSADSLEIVADIALNYKIEPNLMQNLAGMINSTKTILLGSDLESVLRSEGIEQKIKEIAGQHKGYELQTKIKALDGLRQQYIRYGITVQSCTINWRYTQDVLTQIEIKRQDLQRQRDTATTLTDINRIRQQMQILDEQLKFYDLQIHAAKKEAELARVKAAASPELARRDAEHAAQIEQEKRELDMLVELQKKRGAGAGPMIIGGTINIGGEKKQ